jgi:hypothetical protein
MTRPARAALTAAAAILAIAGCTAQAARPPVQQSAAPRHTVRTCPAPSSAPPLPVTPAALGAAVRTASRFSAAYTTWHAGHPQAWLARLRPLATAQLATRLAQAAGTTGGQSSTGTVTSAAIRLITAGMIIVTVQVRQDTSSAGGRASATASLAVTLVPAGGGWQVYDAEPASAGDSGGPGAAP